MSKIENLSYSFLRTEADGKYIIFLKIGKELFEKDLDVNLNDNHQLCIKTESGKSLITTRLSDDIYDSLAHKDTQAFFTDENGDILAQHNLEPLKPRKMKL